MTLLLATLGLVIAALAALVTQVARIQRTHNALIRALQHSVRLSKEASATHQHRADILTKAFAHQQERITLLVAQCGELEDRNAYLERVCRAGAYDRILALPTMDGPRVMERKGEAINLN